RADAFRIMEEALRAEPDNADMHLRAGDWLWFLGEVARAEEYYRRATQINPTYALAFANLGNARRIHGDTDGAFRLLRESVRLDRKAARPHELLGHAHLSGGDFDGAVAEFQEALRLEPGYFNVEQWLDLARQLQADPNRASLHNRRGGFLR